MKTLYLVISFVLIFGCTAQMSEKEKQLTEENKKLQDDYNQLWQQKNNLESQKSAKEKEIAELKDRINKLNQTYNLLHNERDNISQQYVDLQDQYNEIQKTYNNLLTRYSNLEEDYNDLIFQYTEITSRGTSDIPSSPTIDNIKLILTGDSIIIKYPALNISTVTDTKSMHPVITADHTAIFTTNFNQNRLKVGNIIAYKSDSFTIPIMHRIIEVKQTTSGTCYIVQGDNNPVPDPDCVKPSKVIGLVIGTVFNADEDGYLYCSDNSIAFVEDDELFCISKTIQKGVYTQDQEITDPQLTWFPFCSEENNNKPYTVVDPNNNVYCYDTIN